MNVSKVFQNIVQTGARYQEKAKKVSSAMQISNGTEKLANALDCMASSNTVRISKSTSIVELLSKLKNQPAKEFFREIGTKSPKKSEILLNHEAILDYCQSSYGMFASDRTALDIQDAKVVQEAIDKLSEEDIEHVLSTFSKRCKTRLKGDNLLSALVVYSKDKKCYELMMNSSNAIDNVVYSSGYSKDLCEYITNLKPSIVKNMSYDTAIHIQKELPEGDPYSGYTANSDAYRGVSDVAEKLKSRLSQKVTEGDILAYRGEKSSWMFDSIPIDEKMQKKVRMLAFVSPKSRKNLVYPNDRSYSSTPTISIYDYLKSKKNLTLADAMLVCRYADEKFVNEVLHKINEAQVLDESFKSFTLSPDFASRWAKDITFYDGCDLLGMVSRTNIKKGNQVGYSSRSGQYEFIVNNNAKRMTFANASYDPKTNTFAFDSELSVVE